MNKLGTKCVPNFVILLFSVFYTAKIMLCCKIHEFLFATSDLDFADALKEE